MNTREYCLEALMKIDQKNSYSNLVVKEYLNKYSFTSEDKALFTNIIYGVITHKKYLFYVLSKYVKRPHKQQYWVKNLLLMSTYQIYFLNTPDFAVTSEAVKVAKNRGGVSKGNFVNGVLRSIIRDKGKITIPKDDTLKYLSIKYSLEDWMINIFHELFQDHDELESFCLSLNKELPLTLRVNTLKINNEAFLRKLRDMGIAAVQSSLCENGIILEDKVPVSKLDGLLKEGLCIIQEQASIKVVELLAPNPGETILDMCAAPGGKTTLIGQLMNNQGSVLSCDIHSHKLELIRELRDKLGLNIIETMQLDGTMAKDKLKGKAFDKILLDAPCSGLGVIPNKPDIKWTKNKEDILSIVETQKSLLENAAFLLKNNGVMVYSTCTVTKEENEDLIKQFLVSHKEFSLLDEIRLYPHRDKCHGFYMAKLIKR